jgi:hypothetical protein
MRSYNLFTRFREVGEFPLYTCQLYYIQGFSFPIRQYTAILQLTIHVWTTANPVHVVDSAPCSLTAILLQKAALKYSSTEHTFLPKGKVLGDYYCLIGREINVYYL